MVSTTFNYSQDLPIPWEYPSDKYIIKNIGYGNLRIINAKIKIIKIYVFNYTSGNGVGEYSQDFEFDENGRLLRYNKSLGNGVREDSSYTNKKQIFSLNEEGKLIEYNEVGDWFNSNIKRRTVYSYINGTIAEIDYFITQHNVFRNETKEELIKAITYSKTSQGYLEVEKDYDGSIRAQKKIYLDSNSNPSEVELFDKENKLTGKMEIFYNPRGGVSKLKIFDKRKLNQELEFKYDGDMNLIEIKMYLQEKLGAVIKLDNLLIRGQYLPTRINNFDDQNVLKSYMSFEYEFFD